MWSWQGLVPPLAVPSRQRRGALDSEGWMGVSTPCSQALAPHSLFLGFCLRLGFRWHREQAGPFALGPSRAVLLSTKRSDLCLSHDPGGTCRPPKLPTSARWQLHSALPMWHNFVEFTSPHLALIICWLVIVVICLKALSSLPDCKLLLCLAPAAPCSGRWGHPCATIPQLVSSRPRIAHQEPSYQHLEMGCIPA